MQKKPSIKKYFIIFFTALLSTAQLKTNNFLGDHTFQFISSAAIIGALGYAAYLQMNQPAPLTIPDAQHAKIEAIIFDIDGVLSITNKLRAFQEIGFGTTLWEIIDQQTLPSEKMLFDALVDVPAVSTAISYTKGLQIPQIMVDWQAGIQSAPSIQKSITQYLVTSNLPESLKKWVLQSTIMMMNPQLFIATRQTIPANINLPHELKDKGYKLYILSNWDPASFPLFQATFPEIFMHNHKPTFDGIMISGNVGLLKPQAEIFTKCLNDFDLKADKTLFIDDEPANIASATKLKIRTILANPHNTQAVRDELIEQLTR
jgi:beta-phosphoglucomutase-like phosphatase (HAD superfamily)